MTKYTAVYKPLEWQIEPFRDKSPVMVLTGGGGGGKSRVAWEKVNAYLKKYPGATGLAMRKAREWASRSIVPFMLQTVIADDPTVRYSKSDMAFIYNNDSVLYIGGMKDQSQREAIRSIGGDGSVDIACLEEANAFELADFEEVVARMRGKAADWRQIILPTNPDSPYHWIKRRLIDGGGASIYYSKAADNPHNPDSYIDSLKTLSGIRYERLYLGKWVQAEGLVYDGWREDVHLIQPFVIPPDWRRYLAIDFGYTNPFVCLWVAVDGDGRMYVYRQWYMSGMTVSDHAKKIHQLSGGEQFDGVIADSADAEGIATLRQEGFTRLRPSVKGIKRNIELVQERLRPAGDGKRRLYVFRDSLVELDDKLPETVAHNLSQEFALYRWPETKEGKPNKELPIDMNNHALDPLGYLARHLDRGRPQVSANPFY